MRVREEKKKLSKKLKTLYIVILLICIIAIMAAVYIQIYIEDGNAEGSKILTEDESNVAKAKFDDIFQNKVNYMKNSSYKIEKTLKDEEIVYTGYQKKDTKENDYDLSVNIPYINIKNEEIEKINKQIKEIFQTKAENTLNSKNRNIIYTVDYSCYITNNILSLVIRSTLKEGTMAQRDMIQTYNFDLVNQKEVEIEDVLKIRNISTQMADKKIKEEIKTVVKKIEELTKLGYTVYSRDEESEIYNIENITEYFIGENDTIYIIFAYGNQNETSEMDIVVM